MSAAHVGGPTFHTTGRDWCEELLTNGVAICYDVLLEETIKIRDALRTQLVDGATLSDLEAVTDILDVWLRMRPLRHNTDRAARVLWSEFIASDGPKPLDLLLEQPARLIRRPEKDSSVLDLKHYDFVPTEDRLGVARRDGTPLTSSCEPFAPMRKRVRELKLVANQDVLGASIQESVYRICEHYRKYVVMICDFDKRSDPDGFVDLFETDTPHVVTIVNQDGSNQLASKNGYIYIGGNATISGPDLNGRHLIASQRMVSTITQQDEMGQCPEITSGSHPSYTRPNLPLFFKAAAMGNEGSLGTTKERAMHILAESLFGRGVADTALLVVSRHTTVSISEDRRLNPLLKLGIFQPSTQTFMSSTAFDDHATDYDAVKQQQKMYTRLIQVAIKVEGKLLDEVLNSVEPISQINRQSLSETVVYTILTTADDAKGDNFIVQGSDSVLVGIDNDHVLKPPVSQPKWVTKPWVMSHTSDSGPPSENVVSDDSTRASSGVYGTAVDNVPRHVVNFKNILLCHRGVLDTPVHPTVLAALQKIDLEPMLVKLLTQMDQYSRKVKQMQEHMTLANGAPENNWISLEIGSDDAAARMLRLWNRLKIAAQHKGSVSHRDLFQNALPAIHEYYQIIIEGVQSGGQFNGDVFEHTVYEECGRGLHDRVLRWLYYQEFKVNPALRSVTPPPFFIHDVLDTKTRRSICAGIEAGHIPSAAPPGDAASAHATKPHLCLLLAESRLLPMNPSTVRCILEAILQEEVLGLADPGQILHVLPPAWRREPALMTKLLLARVTDPQLLQLGARWLANNTRIPDTTAAGAPTSLGVTTQMLAVQIAVEETITMAQDAQPLPPMLPGSDGRSFDKTESVLFSQLQFCENHGVTVDCNARHTPEGRPLGAQNDDAVLSFVARKFKEAAKKGCVASNLNWLFSRLVNVWGARRLAGHSEIVRYWRCIDSTTPSGKAAVDAIAKLSCNNWRLAWALAVEELLRPNSAISACHLQSAGLGACVILPAAVKELLDDAGAVRRVNATGLRTVGRMTSPVFGITLYFKVRPELPGVECMVRDLACALFGPNAAPPAELARWNHSGSTGIKYDDPVLVSLGVSGRTMLEVLQSDPADRDAVLSSLEPESLSQVLITAMMTMPEDGKPDNYICEEITAADGKKLYRLVCIDNDKSFAPPIARGKSHNGVHLRVKCVLFCLDQMHEPVHSAVRKRICSPHFDILGIVGQWLDTINRVSKRNTSVYADAKRSTKKLWNASEPSTIVVPLEPGLVQKLCSKLDRLRKCLQRTPDCTHFDVMVNVEPLLAWRYRDADYGCSLLDRFYKLDQDGFKLAADGSLTSRFSTKSMMGSMVTGDQLTFEAMISSAAKGVSVNMLKRIRNGEERSPAQGLQELEPMLKAWQELEKYTPALLEILLTPNGQADHIPATVIESIVGNTDMTQLPEIAKNRVLDLLSKRSAEMLVVKLRELAPIKGSALDRALGNNLTILKLINCGGKAFCIKQDGLLSSIAKRCSALELLHYEGNHVTKSFAHTGLRTQPVVFVSLLELRIVNCSKLQVVSVIFGRASGCQQPGRAVIEVCPSLKENGVQISGNLDRHMCRVTNCGAASIGFVASLNGDKAATTIGSVGHFNMTVVLGCYYSGKTHLCDVFKEVLRNFSDNVATGIVPEIVGTREWYDTQSIRNGLMLVDTAGEKRGDATQHGQIPNARCGLNAWLDQLPARLDRIRRQADCKDAAVSAIWMFSVASKADLLCTEHLRLAIKYFDEKVLVVGK